MLHRILAVTILAGATASLMAQSNVNFELYGNASDVPNYGTIVSGDFNNDGKPDLVFCCNSSGLIFQAGNGDGTFQAATNAGSAPNGANALIATDVNGDGKLDLVGLPALNAGGDDTNSLAVWLGNGNGTFQAPQVYTTGNTADSVAVGNFFGDGLPDIAVGENSGLIELFRNEGNGTFVADGTINLGYEYQVQLTAGDLNGTGVSDLAAADTDGGPGNGPGTVYVLWNNGKGSFTQQELSSSYVNPFVSISRLNGDGQMDILVSYVCNPTPSNSAGNGPAYEPCAGFDAYYGQGDNTLYKSTLVTDPGVYNLGIPFGVDVNGDGYGDIVSAGGLSSYSEFGVFVWLGNANGSFQQTPQYSIYATGGAGALTAADFNRDGMMDFAASLYVPEILLNSTARPGCGTYTISPSVTVCQPVDNTYSPSPVTVEATSYDTTRVTGMQEYIDNQLEYSEPVSSLNTTFAEPAGSHFFVTKGWDASGRSFVADRTVTVYQGTPGPVCPAATDSANICLPSGTSSSSPVLIVANGNTGSVPPGGAELYIDGNLAVSNDGYCFSSGDCSGGTSYVMTSQSLSAGTHDLVFKVWYGNGDVYQATKTITVN